MSIPASWTKYGTFIKSSWANNNVQSTFIMQDLTQLKAAIGFTTLAGDIKTAEIITTENIASYQSGLGVGQTYQDVTASRAFGTTYTNSTGKPILVIVAMDNHDVTCVMTPTVGGVDLPSTSTSWNNRVPLSFVVPSGTSYVVSVSTTRSLNKWVELR